MTGDPALSITEPTDTQILITRRFAAPPHLVYRAWTEPELIKRWWAGDHGQVSSADIDLRVGGTWQYVTRSSNGTEVAFRGEFREILPNSRIVNTEVFEPVPDQSALNTITFTGSGDGTTLTMLVEHGSKAARDWHLASGMEGGLRAALDRLEQIATALS